MADVDDLWYRADRTPTVRCGKGRRWCARWRDPAGRQRKRSFARKLDAERHLAKVTSDLARGAYIDPAAGRTTVAEFAAAWLAGQSTDPATRESVEVRVRVHILPVLGHLELGRLRPSHVRSWTAGLTVAPGYARGIYGTLSAILSAAVDDELIARNPCHAPTVRRPPRGESRVVPMPAGMVLELEARLGAFVTAGAGLGLRQGELFGLAAGDIDWLRRWVHVRRQVKLIAGGLYYAPPKGGRERDVPLPESVGLALAAHIAACPPVPVTLPTLRSKQETAALLFTDDGKPWRRDVFNSRIWRPAGAPAGVHALRHYAASAWLAGGASIKDVSVYLGHADPGFTLRCYIHLMPDAADRMRAAADAALGAETRGDGGGHNRRASGAPNSPRA